MSVMNRGRQVVEVPTAEPRAVDVQIAWLVSARALLGSTFPIPAPIVAALNTASGGSADCKLVLTIGRTPRHMAVAALHIGGHPPIEVSRFAVQVDVDGETVHVNGRGIIALVRGSRVRFAQTSLFAEHGVPGGRYELSRED